MNDLKEFYEREVGVARELVDLTYLRYSDGFTVHRSLQAYKQCLAEEEFLERKREVIGPN